VILPCVRQGNVTNTPGVLSTTATGLRDLRGLRGSKTPCASVPPVTLC